MRKLFFILLICNMLFVNAQSLELENWKIINSSELNAGAAEVSQLSYPCLLYTSPSPRDTR